MILIVFFAGFLHAKCPESDLNRDCMVDLLDVQVFTRQWMAPAEIIADLNADNTINLCDFALLAGQWNTTRG